MPCLRRVAFLGLWLVAATTQAEQFGDFYYGVSDSNVWIFGYTGLGGDVVIPEAISNMPVTTIDRDAFENVTSMTSVTIPTNVTSIGNGAFLGCTGLATVNLSANINDFSAGVFAKCSGLTNITVSPDNPVLSSSNGILYDKTGTTLVQFPGGIGGAITITGSVTSISSDAFLGNTTLTNVILPEILAEIGSWAFSGCNGLANVMIPASVSNLASGVFGNCANLTAIWMAESNAWYSSSNGILWNKSQTMLIQYPAGLDGSYAVPAAITNIMRDAFSGCVGLTAVTIPNSVAMIDYYTFSGCTGLTNIVLNEGITNIGSGAFSGCSALESIHIPDSVTRLAWGAFQDCSALTNIVLGAGIAIIESRVFYECNNLRNLYIPESVTNLWNGAFDYCHGLTNITVAANNPTYSSIDGVVFDKDHGSLLYFPEGIAGRYIVPEGVQLIEGYAFDNCGNLTCVELPSSVIILGRYAFSHCTNLTSMCFNGTPPSLGLQTFLFADNVVMYYRAENAAAWGTAFAEHPTAIWPEFSTADIQPAGFVFDVVASEDQEVVLEMCPDLGAEDWTPVSTQTVSGGSLEITIPDWASDPARFYRVTVH